MKSFFSPKPQQYWKQKYATRVSFYSQTFPKLKYKYINHLYTPIYLVILCNVLMSAVVKKKKTQCVVDKYP